MVPMNTAITSNQSLRLTTGLKLSMADAPFAPMEAPVEQQCVYKAPSGLNIALACILMIGGVISFIPQVRPNQRNAQTQPTAVSKHLSRAFLFLF